MTDVPPIRCDRFDLLWLSLSMVETLMKGDSSAVSRELDVRFPEGEWIEKMRRGLTFRRDDMLRDPDVAPWMTRLIVLPDRRVAGYINFHGPPDSDRVCELGYTVFEAFRRQSIASDAALCIMRWARDQHSVRRFRLSISPENAPSLGMAQKLGFVRTGEQMDEIDGLEYVFELTID